jgi:uncharacterized membrane protein YhaH (DUF805 family)
MTFTPAPPRMSFGAAITSGFRKYVQFSGRAGIAEFWWFILFVYLVNAGARTLDTVLGLGEVTDTSPISSLWMLATFLPVLSLAVRRLRDGGNDWTKLFWLLLPIAGLIIVIIRLCDPPVAAAGPPSFGTPYGQPVQDAPPGPVRDAPVD